MHDAASATAPMPAVLATAWLSTDADAEHSPVGWALNEITVGILHSPEREAL